MQCLSFILLRRGCRTSNRGRIAARWASRAPAIAGVIAVVSLVSLYSNDDYRPGVYGALATTCSG